MFSWPTWLANSWGARASPDARFAIGEAGRRVVDPRPLFTHRYELDQIEEAYDPFAHQREGVLKVAITPQETTGANAKVENWCISGIICLAWLKPGSARCPFSAGPPVVRMSAGFSTRAFVNSADRGKDTLSGNQPPAREIARRLISGRRSERKGGDTAARAAAAACDNLYRELSRWVGPDGCHALFTRALAETRTEYPALAQIQLRARSEPYIDGVAETIMAHGDPVTAGALESMLIRLVELLGRLIGDDMAVKLIEQSQASSEHGDGPSDDRREEAWTEKNER
jgi:hypothetical protein